MKFDSSTRLKKKGLAYDIFVFKKRMYAKLSVSAANKFQDFTLLGA